MGVLQFYVERRLQVAAGRPPRLPECRATLGQIPGTCVSPGSNVLAPL